MKHLLGILLLVTITCKVIEPSLFAWQFFELSEAESVSVYDEQVREIKIYHPLPYHNSTEAEADISELYQDGDKFYNVVEKRFSKDTFYLKIQDNLSAREQFFALGNAVKDLKIDTKKENKSNSKSSQLSLEDFSKVYLPMTSPQIVRQNWLFNEDSYMSYSNFLLSFSSPFLSVFSPPPNC